MSQVARVKFADYRSSIAKALDLVGAAGRLPQEGLIIIKPNLTNSFSPLVTTTISMKNMFGIAPGRFYAGGWNKLKLHSPSTAKSVVDVCLYKKSDPCVVDAAVALKGSHLSGRHKNIGLILAGFDAVGSPPRRTRP